MSQGVTRLEFYFILDGDEKSYWTKVHLQDVLADDDLTVRGTMGKKTKIVCDAVVNNFFTSPNMIIEN
jgi:hypothetical protein